MRFILDGGAHCGYATLQLAHRYPQAKIVAVEADPVNYAQLVRNTAHVPNIVAVHAAIWSRDNEHLHLNRKPMDLSTLPPQYEKDDLRKVLCAPSSMALSLARWHLRPSGSHAYMHNTEAPLLANEGAWFVAIVPWWLQGATLLQLTPKLPRV